MKLIVYLNKTENKFYLVEKRVGTLLTLRLLTRTGAFTPTKKMQDAKAMRSVQWERIPDCKLYQRVKFNKVAVDKVAFDDFMFHLNNVLAFKVEAARKDEDKEVLKEVLRKVGVVVFSCFHLTKKQGATFNLDDVLDKAKTHLLKVAIKKSMVQYLHERFDNFQGNELEDSQVVKELELAKTMFVFSENHGPIKKAAKLYMNLITTDMKDRFIEEWS
jgi:hypothetical protein